MAPPVEPAPYFEAMEARLTAGVSERMVALAGVTGGEAVLNLACGRGEPAWRLARAVGPAGKVVGVDIAADRLDAAQELARREGLLNTRWVCVDGEAVDSLGERFDVVTSRWGLPSFGSPVRALAGIRRALRLSRLHQIERDLGAAGFRIEHVEEHDVTVVEGETGAELARWVEVVLGRLLDGVEAREACLAALAEDAERHRVGDRVRLGGVTRIVVAR